MQSSIETYIIDSFTNEPFKGNPAGVCLLNKVLDDTKMLTIAKELGLSETAFIIKNKDKSYAIRFFSPKMEIVLCGHATLAASKVVFEKEKTCSTIHFKTIQGIDLLIKKDNKAIVMQFPVYNTVSKEVPKALLDALELDTINNSEYNTETKILLLEIDNCAILQSLSPNFENLKKSHNSINGVLVTAISKQENYDFESRYFWPWSGTNEDPVTGGTHTFLAKYWSTRLQKQKMNSFQCSERTGFMEVELLDNHKMTIKSEAQIVFKGELFL